MTRDWPPNPRIRRFFKGPDLEINEKTNSLELGEECSFKDGLLKNLLSGLESLEKACQRGFDLEQQICAIFRIFFIADIFGYLLQKISAI